MQCDIASTLDLFGKSKTRPSNTKPGLLRDKAATKQSVAEVGKRKRDVAETDTKEESSKGRKRKKKKTTTSSGNDRLVLLLRIGTEHYR